MAIVFSKSSAKNDNLWNEWAPQLMQIMKDTDLEKNSDDEVLNSIFNVKKSKKFGEKATGMTSFGDFEIVEEGADGIQDDFSESYSKLIQHHQFLKTFVCTAEMAEDGEVDVMKARAANFVNSYKRSRLAFATAMLTGSTKATFDFGQKTGLDCLGGDGKPLFATDHPMFKYSSNASKNQSNIFTNDLGNDARMLNRLANIGRNYHNNSDHVMGTIFNTIIIPSNCYEMEETIKRIIGSTGEVGSNNNDINTQKGKWKLVINHLWEVEDGQNPYILMSSQLNKAANGNVFFDRIPLTMKDEILVPSHNLRNSGRARFSAGFYDWRHMIMGGAKTGTTLE